MTHQAFILRWAEPVEGPRKSPEKRVGMQKMFSKKILKENSSRQNSSKWNRVKYAYNFINHEIVNIYWIFDRPI